MANCCNMKKDDLFVCDACGLKLKVENSCTCKPDSEGACNVPLSCCGKEMTQKP